VVSAEYEALLAAERRVSALANSPRNNVSDVVRPVDG